MKKVENDEIKYILKILSFLKFQNKFYSVTLIGTFRSVIL